MRLLNNILITMRSLTLCVLIQWFARFWKSRKSSETYVSSVDEELIKAYIATDFQVNTDPTFEAQNWPLFTGTFRTL